ncbi:MAG: hypothetical protein HKP59_08900 [Lutibacter sp.]|uniref:hypothetical protein n=1 Tax=Lutibacter sp. TaxID=1925666 RepID=UPI0018347C4D|nr:hypothetical protein [Lutibacter sp.]MBT8317734.1 hypothetical protein [Lutibacter sp.]NNJ58592.1 hypothetical protein [Lutibacter sp.]
MKTKITVLFLSLFIALLTSCQTEVSEIIQPPENEALQANTTVATLVQKTATKDGSIDNIIDNASCISVQLPVTVNVNGLEIIIDSEDDFDVIEAIFDEFDDDYDSLDIIFPIVIILSDFSEINIANVDELESFIDQCEGENEFDDDIECIDFIYPITLSIFDSENQLAETITVENDEDFYHLIDEIEDYHIVQINFPISVELYDGTILSINDMEELENAIDDADGMCDEDDDNDYDDDDCDDCTEEQIRNLLVLCSWTVDKIIVNDLDKTEQYTNFVFTYFEDGSVVAKAGGNEIIGTWIVETTMDEIIVKLEFDNFSDFSFNWVLYEIEDDNEIELRFEDNKLEFEKRCIDENSELVDILKEGTWIVANFTDDGENYTNEYHDFVFDFKENFIVTATKNDDVVNGTWAVIYDDGKLKLELDFGETTPFDELNDDWVVVEIENLRVEVNDLDDDGNEESNLVFERNN